MDGMACAQVLYEEEAQLAGRTKEATVVEPHWMGS